MRDKTGEGGGAMTRIGWGCLAAVLALLLLTGNGRSAAPPVAPRWVAGELRRAEQIEARAAQAVMKGNFALALRLSQEVLAARRALLGERHWQTVEARLKLERWARLARLPAEKHRQAGAALRREEEGRQYLNQGRFAQAEKAYREALDVYREALGDEHSETGVGYHMVAVCLNFLGKYSEALPLHRKALMIFREAHGEEHPRTATGYNGVASCLYVLGKETEALSLYRKALRIRTRSLGEEHPETALSCTDLAGCLNRSGKTSEGLPLVRKALEIYRKALGEEHPITASSYNNVALCLHGLGKTAEALPLLRRALQIQRKVYGEDHPDTATGYNNLAMCLSDLGKHAEALPLDRKALEITRKAFGEEHPHTGLKYHNLASCLQELGQVSGALPLFRQALLIRRKVHGEDHPETAHSYNGVARCLHGLGQVSESLPYYRQALLIRRKVHGEDHPDTAQSYNNVAGCLNAQGKAAEALPLYREALQIRSRVLGEEHFQTAHSYNNVALCLHALGQHTEALSLLRKALEFYRKALGDDHPATANGYSNVAFCLDSLGKTSEALPLFRKALMIQRKALGEEHPDTARGYNNVAFCLDSLGKHTPALPLFRKALMIQRKAFGEEHPLTTGSYTNVAFCLYALGKREEAIRHLRLALLGMDVSRHSAAAAGFDRSLFAATQAQPRLLLACLLAGEGKAAEAWRHAESHLARGLLEALWGGREREESDSGELAKVDARIVTLLGVAKPGAEQKKERDDLVEQRRALLAARARRVAERMNKLVWSFPQVQKHLRADAALLLWLDAADEHFACVLRKEGQPRFVRLPGSGKDGTWTNEDWQLASRVHAAVRQTGKSAADPLKLVEQLRKQRLTAVQKHLKADGKLPAVRRLVVLPTGWMAFVPVELLAEGYTVSYAPSATLFAQQASKPRPLRLDSLVVLGDPVFAPPREKAATAPAYGLLLRSVLPGGNAARAGLRAGDVLMRYNGVRLRQLADFKAAADERVKASAWREGEVFAIRLRGGPLGASVDERPIAKALPVWRETEALVRGEGASFVRLPGTRYEVEAIASMVGKDKATLLLGSAASEQKLDRLIKDGTLGKARVIHLATHGRIHPHSPEHSALVLAGDKLPDPVEQQRRGRKLYDGFLRVRTIVDSWKLDADLVVLSACETGLGKNAGGEGLLGFAQAFLQKGARSVVLSRWKVDDDATALLMLRFYENLLGKRNDLKKPLARAEALAEAKKWLRSLDRKQAEGLVGRLAGGKLRGTIDKALPEVKGTTVKVPEGDRPFGQPAYWAAFVLVGDPS
jgi:tetratricopeptide (TPR) repeat protein